MDKCQSSTEERRDLAKDLALLEFERKSLVQTSGLFKSVGRRAIRQWPHSLRRAIDAEDLLRQLVAVKISDPMAALTEFADIQEAAAKLLGIKWPGEEAPGNADSQG